MKALIIVVFMFFCVQAMSLTTKTIECKYNNGIDNIVFTTVKNEFKTERKIGGNKIDIFIGNINKPSESNDYISFSKNGRTMTFSLNCKKI